MFRHIYIVVIDFQYYNYFINALMLRILLGIPLSGMVDDQPWTIRRMMEKQIHMAKMINILVGIDWEE